MIFIKKRLREEHNFVCPVYIPQFKILFLPWIDYKSDYCLPIMFLDKKVAEKFISK